MLSLITETVWQDVRFGLRSFRRNPAFSLTAVLVIALGIGATTAVFSVVDRLLFRSLPYPRPEQLVSVGITIPIMDGEFLMANDYLHIRDEQTALSAVTSWTGVADCDLTEDHPQRLACAQVESTFLPVFGIEPLAGRNFNREEDRPQSRKVALISYALWKSRFGGGSNAVGTTIEVDGARTEIIGILPRDFELPNLAHADLVVPQALAISQYRPGQSGRPIRVFGRLKNGVSMGQASELLQPYLREGFKAAIPRARWKEVHTVLRSLREYQVHDVKLASWMLLGATFSILMIVCANVANLMLARSMSRRAEMAIRTALGAGRGRLTAQNFTEAILLSGFGAGFGYALAWVLLDVFKWLAPTSVPRLGDASLDERMVLFAVAMALVCGTVFGFTSTASEIKTDMPSGHRLTGDSKSRVRQWLTSAQVAVCLMLISVAGLLVQSLWKLQNVTPGVRVDQVIVAEATVNTKRYPNTAIRQQFFDRLAERLRAMPRVEAVAISDTVPPAGFVHTRPLAALRVLGQPGSGRIETGLTAWRSVTPDYFNALGIPILRGRNFTEAETTSKENSVIVSASLARRLFRGEEPISKTMQLTPGSPVYTVIGVARDAKNEGLAQEADPEYYVLRKKITDLSLGTDQNITSRSLHFYDGDACFIVRTTAPMDAAANWIRSETAAIDPTVPVKISTMQGRIDAISERPRFSAALLSFFAFIGVALAAAGLYGLISFQVVQRTQEVGVRMALGATPSGVVRMMLGDALRPTVAGAIIGLAGTTAAVRYVGSLLFEVRAEDPVLFVSVAILMIAVAMLASLGPSLRAARVDPAVALRHD